MCASALPSGANSAIARQCGCALTTRIMRRWNAATSPWSSADDETIASHHGGRAAELGLDGGGERAGELDAVAARLLVLAADQRSQPDPALTASGTSAASASQSSLRRSGTIAAVPVAIARLP